MIIDANEAFGAVLSKQNTNKKRMFKYYENFYLKYIIPLAVIREYV